MVGITRFGNSSSLRSNTEIKTETIMEFTSNISFRIILIGDASELNNNKNSVIDTVKKQFNLDDDKTSIIYLSDNVYPSGIPEEGSKNYEEAINILRYQASVGMKSSTQVYFVPVITIGDVAKQMAGKN